MNFPNESSEYREARDRLLESELALRRQEEAVAAERRELPLGGELKEDYVFDAAAGPVRFSELFAPDLSTLLLYNFMFVRGERGLPLEAPCQDCTSIIDGLDGALRHITRRVNFVLVAKAPIEQFVAHGQSRGWRNARLLSSAHSTFNADYLAETEDGSQLPVAHVFERTEGRIHHFWSSELLGAPRDPGQHPRHVDFMWPMWAVLDRTPAGRGTDWRPQLDYGP